ncbi:MAG: 3-isopropylmalate dehydrogenase, partial [Steroidobacteraceae bacterium]|nr:3-isopropylmalate dehydrogenase [Steroidobacteraceae bacterium]MDW8258365.1 3-isopropylmalate dehydrogenase [Gammaproteobacteria bacterium]
LLELRRALGVYANLRPIRLYPPLLDASVLKPAVLRDVDLLFVRELTGGIYFGRKGRDADSAFDECRYSKVEIARAARVAGRLARNRRRLVTQIDKSNVLETSRLWREVSEQVLRAEFPDVRIEHLYVDAAAMHLLTRPREFDVLLTENLFGDILTDEAAMLAGSLGVLPSASLGDGPRGLYEPIHGSAPDIAGQGIANPIGTILSAALLLRHSLGLDAEAAAIERAVLRALERGARTRDLARDGEAPLGTAQMGDAILRELDT